MIDPANIDLVEFLRKKINPDLSEYMSDDYEGVALHTSSIIVAANDATCNMFGYSEEEVIGMNAWRLFSHESADTIMQHLLEKSEEPYEVVGIRKDKTHFKLILKGHDFEISGEPVRVVLLKELK